MLKALRPRMQHLQSRRARLRASSRRVSSYRLVVVELVMRELQAGQQLIIVRLLSVLEVDHGRSDAVAEFGGSRAGCETKIHPEDMLRQNARTLGDGHVVRHLVGGGACAIA